MTQPFMTRRIERGLKLVLDAVNEGRSVVPDGVNYEEFNEAIYWIQQMRDWRKSMPHSSQSQEQEGKETDFPTKQEQESQQGECEYCNGDGLDPKYREQLFECLECNGTGREDG